MLSWHVEERNDRRREEKRVEGFISLRSSVMELKMHGTAQEALDQINSKDYAIPYQADGKPVIKIGMAFSQETKTLKDWIIA